MKNENNQAKRIKTTLFMTLIGVVVIGIIAIFLFTSDLFDREQVSTGKQQLDVPMYELSIAEFETLFPNWTYVDHRDLVIDGKHFIAVLKEQSIDTYEGIAKLAIIRFDPETEQWNSQWVSDEAFLYSYGIDAFITVNPPNEKVALVGFNISLGGTSGATDVYTYAIDSEGIGSDLYIDWGYSLEENENQLVVIDAGKKIISIENGEASITHIPPSEVASEEAKKAYFTLDSYEYVVPKDEKVIYVNEGESVAVVPANNREKLLFDQQSILIYTGQLFTESPYEQEIYTSNAHMVRHGNEITFTEKGVHYIYLEYYNGTYYEEEATFYVIVGEMEEFKSKHQYSFKVPKELMDELIIREDEVSTIIFYNDDKFLKEPVFLLAIYKEEMDYAMDHPFAVHLEYDDKDQQMYLLEMLGESPYVMHWYGDDPNNPVMREQSDRYHEIFDELKGIVEVSFQRK